MKPIVGVMPLWDKEKDSLWMLPGYLDGISQAGGIPIVFPFTTDEQELRQLMRMCDGFLFTGGHDVSPMVYNEEPLEDLIDCCEKRDRMETIVLKEAISDDKPVLGICRGIQFINAVLGGKLYQDLPTQHPSETVHRQPPPFDRPVHDVSIVRDTPLYSCFGADRVPVNSHHHQAIRTTAPALKPMAFSPDGLIEAVFMPEKKFLWAVQWHPERLLKTDPHSRELFRAFINSMLS